MHRFFIFINFFLLTTSLFAQIKGNVTDDKGEPLPFVNIYVKGTSIGTTTNMDGVYDWDLPKGDYQIVFQYVGYQSKTQAVQLTDEVMELSIQLQAESIKLSEIVVRANAEDPAYAIIRKAIAKRTYYRDIIKAYSCDTYIKGMMKFLDAPDKFMGQEIGNMDGDLDSTRQGISYLSESESRLYYQYPDDRKEVMLSSKVSGNDMGFGFNRATLLDFNFYENKIQLFRQLVSPIADNAFSYYKYRLIGTVFDEDGRLINKIKISQNERNRLLFQVIFISQRIYGISKRQI